MIKIRYAEDETGWVQYLGHRLARIANHPFADGLYIDDIVRLNCEPGKKLPSIVEIVSSRFTHHTDLRFDDENQLRRLTMVMRALGGDCYPALPGVNGHRGLVTVAHNDNVDPVALAESIGIPQDCDVESCCSAEVCEDCGAPLCSVDPESE